MDESMDDDKPVTWKVQINGEQVQEFTTRTSLYKVAAMAALAQLEYTPQDDYDVVKIWVESLLPDYGPYFYAFDGYQIGYPEENRKF